MSKSEPKDRQSEPKGSQREPKGSQRERKGSERGAKGSQKGAKVSQREPKGSQREPKGSQKASKNRCPEKVSEKGAPGTNSRTFRRTILGPKTTKNPPTLGRACQTTLKWGSIPSRGSATGGAANLPRQSFGILLELFRTFVGI